MLIDNIIKQANVNTQQEYRVFLHKANGELIREITPQLINREYKPILGGCDTFSFSIHKQHHGKPTESYAQIIGSALIRVSVGGINIGYFEIQNPVIDNDGIKEVKNITTLSREISLINKTIFLPENVYKLVNDAYPEKGILNIINKISPSWSVGDIDFSLLNKERYFDVVDSNPYEFLLNQVQEAFDCLIEFDSVNKLINVRVLEGYGEESSIYVSLNNILMDAKVTELSEGIFTSLNLYGDNELSIREVNFGSTRIQDYSYFKNTNFMSQSLINTLNAYDILVANSTVTYTNYLSTLSSLEGQLVTNQTDLIILQGELKTLEVLLSYKQSINESTTSTLTLVNAKKSQISSKKNIINSLISNINSTNLAIDNLINVVDINNNLTLAQIKELDAFIKEDTYQDSSFAVTDAMTYNQIIDIKKQLLEQGKTVLSRVSKPRYKIDINVLDFLKNKEFAPWWNELKIGDLIRLNIDDTYDVYVRVVSYTHNWDSNSLTIQIGNRYQIDDATIELIELLKNSITTSTSVNFERTKYKDYVNNDRNEVLDFINSSLDLNKNAVVGGVNQEMLFDSSGLLMRRYEPTLSNFSPKQLKITNNAIVLTDDGFNSAKTAIGQLANGQYGISAEVIAGIMILGNNMIIQTGNGDFRVDGSGVNITKMALNLTSADNLKNILIDPSVGLKIRSRLNTSQGFVDRFFFDNATGKFKFNGDLQAAGGTFSGALSAATGTFSGALVAATGTFSGSLVAPTIIGGTITGASILAGDPSFGKVRISSVAGDGALQLLNAQGTSIFQMYSIGSSNEIQFQSLNNNRISILAGLGNFTASGQNVTISASSRLAFEAFGADIRFNTLPTIGGIDYLATRNYISSQGYASQNYVNSQGFITSSYAVKDHSSQGISLQYLSGNNSVEVRVNGLYKGAIFLV